MRTVYAEGDLISVSAISLYCSFFGSATCLGYGSGSRLICLKLCIPSVSASAQKLWKPNVVAPAAGWLTSASDVAGRSAILLC